METARYKTPLEKLGFDKLEQLTHNVLFQLIDFGLAQRELQTGGFESECTSGDAGYICQQFMLSGKPDYSSDIFSFGVTLLECLTGIQVPLNDAMFEVLRSGDFLDYFDKETFGANLKGYIH